MYILYVYVICMHMERDGTVVEIYGTLKHHTTLHNTKLHHANQQYSKYSTCTGSADPDIGT